MKLACHIIKVEDVGDKLRVTMQGAGVGESEGARWSPHVVEVQNTLAARRTYYVGRSVSVHLQPEKAV